LVRQFASSLVPLPLYKQSLQFIENYNPDNLIVSKMAFDRLVRKPDDILVKNWDKETPFHQEVELLIPIYSFRTGEYSGQCIRLDHKIFNLPLRRDIVHRVMVYESKLGKANIHASKTLSNVTKFNLRPPIQEERSDRRRAPVEPDSEEEELLEDSAESRPMAARSESWRLPCQKKSDSLL
jgi:hypothetical protein